MPDIPWTKNDVYELLTSNRTIDGSSIETIHCMLANQPPDVECMGYSFNKKDFHGFALFLE